MSFLLWFQRLFVPKDEGAEGEDLPELEDNEPFVFTQHLRIIIAIVFTFISALFMWWIVV